MNRGVPSCLFFKESLHAMSTEMKQPPVTILIADDHQLFRESLRKLLEGSGEFLVIGETANGADTIHMTRDLRPDVLLLDLLMPGTSGVEALREVAKLTPPVRTLVLTAEAGNADIVEALQLGARGVVLKHLATEMLFTSLRAVMAGEYWVCHECVGDLVESMRRGARPSPASSRSSAVEFTPRQREIVSAIVAGGTNRDIAKQFSISATTVKYHLTHMFEKVGVSNRIELARFAMQHRMDSIPPRH